MQVPASLLGRMLQAYFQYSSLQGLVLLLLCHLLRTLLLLSELVMTEQPICTLGTAEMAALDPLGCCQGHLDAPPGWDHAQQRLAPGMQLKLRLRLLTQASWGPGPAAGMGVRPCVAQPCERLPVWSLPGRVVSYKPAVAVQLLHVAVQVLLAARMCLALPDMMQLVLVLVQVLVLVLLWVQLWQAVVVTRCSQILHKA